MAEHAHRRAGSGISCRRRPLVIHGRRLLLEKLFNVRGAFATRLQQVTGGEAFDVVVQLDQVVRLGLQINTVHFYAQHKKQ